MVTAEWEGLGAVWVTIAVVEGMWMLAGAGVVVGPGSRTILQEVHSSLSYYEPGGFNGTSETFKP